MNEYEIGLLILSITIKLTEISVAELLMLCSLVGRDGTLKLNHRKPEQAQGFHSKKDSYLAQARPYCHSVGEI